ncbi:DUF4926 domain-containing protein [Mycolicibacter virginiensis]|uniref:DUF4926 domain-containing protein n=1 Tax=Mycolicibacter virginiensis TaxID=1795032 RepID=UPI001F03C625|nr:DUF4926 domain-containing protein [Mycolicibacter virginiensis]ULP48042.1 DUF4926 domain-containing protein [Mycolicibacter virginiensis]
MYPEHSSVELTRDLPDEGLAAGATGAVVHAGTGAYEVEFFTPDGSTIAVVTVEEADIRLRS